MIELTREPIDVAAALLHVQSPQAGAVVLFLGTTREYTGDRRTASLEYDGYQEMALRKLEELEGEARRQWPVVECLIVHRLGTVGLGQASVLIAVSSAHRDAAFQAGKWLIDTLKEVVPIWKKELWADGTSEWVHPSRSEVSSPGASSPEASSQ